MKLCNLLILHVLDEIDETRRSAIGAQSVGAHTEKTDGSTAHGVHR